MPNIGSCGTPKYSGGTGEHAAARIAAATTRISDFALIRPTSVINWQRSLSDLI
jgi:hypothetical protein